MKIATVVSIADILAEPGAPLVSDYWTDRLENESYAVWQQRKDLEWELAHVRKTLARLKRLYPDAWEIAQQMAAEEAAQEQARARKQRRREQRQARRERG